jgi:DNA topoisomerase-1
MNRAVDVLAKKLASVRSLGPHPKDQVGVTVRKGRFGPYAQHGQTVATLPRGVMMDDITLEQAVALLAERGKQLAPKGRKGKPKAGTKAAAKVKAAAETIAKTPAKKTAATKPRKQPAPAKKAAGKPRAAKSAG